MLILKELLEYEEASATRLLEKAAQASGLVAGGERDADGGVKKKGMRREDGPFATSTYYTISTISVKVNISIVVSMRWEAAAPWGAWPAEK